MEPAASEGRPRSFSTVTLTPQEIQQLVGDLVRLVAPETEVPFPSPICPYAPPLPSRVDSDVLSNDLVDVEAAQHRLHNLNRRSLSRVQRLPRSSSPCPRLASLVRRPRFVAVDGMGRLGRVCAPR